MNLCQRENPFCDPITTDFVRRRNASTINRQCETIKILFREVHQINELNIKYYVNA